MHGLQRTAIDAAPIPDNWPSSKKSHNPGLLGISETEGKKRQPRERNREQTSSWMVSNCSRPVAGRLSAIHSNAGGLRALAPMGSNFEGKSAMLSALFWITSRGTRRLLRAGCNGGKRVKLFRRPKPSFIGTTSRFAASATVAQPGKPRQLGPLLRLFMLLLQR